MVRSAYLAGLITALLLAVPGARADDTTRLLAGAGSLSSSADGRTITLKGGANDADTHEVCCWRKWCDAYYCAPVCAPVVCAAPAYYAPAYYAPTYHAPLPVPTPMTAPPPAAGPAAYYYRPNRFAPETFAVAPTPSPITRPSIVVGYQGRFFSGSLALRPFARIGAAAAPSYFDQTEMAPSPRGDDTYRYDGGPSRTVPMPTPDPVSPNDPVPTTIPALYRGQVERSKAKVTYPAYGEKPASKPKVVDPLVVMRTGGR